MTEKVLKKGVSVGIPAYGAPNTYEETKEWEKWIVIHQDGKEIYVPFKEAEELHRRLGEAIGVLRRIDEPVPYVYTFSSNDLNTSWSYGSWNLIFTGEKDEND